jgi:putative oxidoreductase
VFLADRESSSLCKGHLLQRLFSNFANGWPGTGLLILRLIIAGIAFVLTFVPAGNLSLRMASVPCIIQFSAGILILIGLWTPLAGAFIAVVEVWIVLSHADVHSVRIVLAALGAAVAMIGPGAWSVDARLFGRKVVEFAERDSPKGGRWRE